MYSIMIIYLSECVEGLLSVMWTIVPLAIYSLFTVVPLSDVMNFAITDSIALMIIGYC